MLTDLEVRNFKPEERRYSKADGEGLSIDVFPSGTKSWVLTYRVYGKQKREKMGSFPAVGCKEARLKARKFKAEATGNAQEAPTVAAVKKEWLEIKLPTLTSQKYADTVVYRIDYITTGFENTPIDKVTRRQISTNVKKMVKNGTYVTAVRCLGLLNEMFIFAISSDYTESNPCAVVDKLIPKHEVKHYPALDVKQMPEFWRRIRFMDIEPENLIALKLVCYTGVRITELLKARWDTQEFDFQERQWTIPASRMKKRKDHVVPLTDSTLALFKELYDTRIGNGYLFKKRGKALEHVPSETILAIIKRAGYDGDMVTHGFRTIMSTHANGSKLFRPEMIDFQLAHVNKSTKEDKTSKIYNRFEYWDERVELMEWYSKQVDSWIAPPPQDQGETYSTES